MQGRSNKQYQDSARFAGIAAFAIVTIILIMSIGTLFPPSQGGDPRPAGPGYNYWMPTDEDKMYLDSLYTIVKETESNVDTISNTLDRCIKKLDNIDK
jgi:hypothetical protein